MALFALLISFSTFRLNTGPILLKITPTYLYLSTFSICALLKWKSTTLFIWLNTIHFVFRVLAISCQSEQYLNRLSNCFCKPSSLFNINIKSSAHSKCIKRSLSFITIPHDFVRYSPISARKLINISGLFDPPWFTPRVSYKKSDK